MRLYWAEINEQLWDTTMIISEKLIEDIESRCGGTVNRPVYFIIIRKTDDAAKWSKVSAMTGKPRVKTILFANTMPEVLKRFNAKQPINTVFSESRDEREIAMLPLPRE